MHLFTRDAILWGPPAKTRQWATDVAGAFTAATDKEIAVWTSIAGGTVGHYVWGRAVEGTEDVLNTGLTALMDEAYLAEVDKGMDYIQGTATDTVYTPINEWTEGTSQAGSIAMVTKASAKAGSLFGAIEWGLKALELGQNAAGITTTMFTCANGPYSELVWLAIVPDAAAADAANQKLQSDPGYLGHLASGTEVFVDGSGNRQMFLRLA